MNAVFRGLMGTTCLHPNLPAERTQPNEPWAGLTEEIVFWSIQEEMVRPERFELPTY
jgi:hypothetical protein